VKILFRTDASLEIGTGHVMRCLALAHALRERGAHCQFVCRTHKGNMLDLIQHEGFDALALPIDSNTSAKLAADDETLYHADWLGTHWEIDAEQTINALEDSCPDWIVVDHYALDVRWESMLRPKCARVMVIDDLADRDHDCVLLLDQNLIADMEHRYDSRVPSNCTRLLGPGYALLQPEYAELHPRTPPRIGRVRHILVYFGGSDNHNLTGLAIAAFLALDRPDIMFDVVINPVNPNIVTIREQTQDHINITLHETLPSLAPLLLKADLAIGAGGTTSWERCCLGLPSLVITLAENQKPIVVELDKQRLVCWLGHHDMVSEHSLKTTLKDVLDTEGVADTSNRCRDVVDGKGAERVAATVLLNSNTHLNARLACVDDEDLLLHWANDPLVRQNAFNPSVIATEEHRIWFYKSLRDPDNCRIYIVETAVEGLPIGQVRFERSDGGWEIDLALDAAARGRGLGKKLLQITIKSFQRLMSGTLVFGRVKKDNLASQKVFDGLSFTPEEDKGGGQGYRYFLQLGSLD